MRKVSHATRAWGSSARIASSTASLIWSAILSGMTLGHRLRREQVVRHSCLRTGTALRAPSLVASGHASSVRAGLRWIERGWIERASRERALGEPVVARGPGRPRRRTAFSPSYCTQPGGWSTARRGRCPQPRDRGRGGRAGGGEGAAVRHGWQRADAHAARLAVHATGRVTACSANAPVYWRREPDDHLVGGTSRPASELDERRGPGDVALPSCVGLRRAARRIRSCGAGRRPRRPRPSPSNSSSSSNRSGLSRSVGSSRAVEISRLLLALRPTTTSVDELARIVHGDGDSWCRRACGRARRARRGSGAPMRAMSSIQSAAPIRRDGVAARIRRRRQRRSSRRAGRSTELALVIHRVNSSRAGSSRSARRTWSRTMSLRNTKRHRRARSIASTV